MPWLVLAAILIILLLMKTEPADAGELAPFVSDILLTREQIVQEMAAKYNIPARRINAIILQESRNKASAVGLAGERGLMQVSIGALTDWNRAFGSGSAIGFGQYSWSDMFDPRPNIDVGTGYLSLMVDKTGNLDDATQAYNAGFSNFVMNHSNGLAYLNSVKRLETLFP